MMETVLEAATVGIDTGGTFTDLVAIEHGRVVRRVKVPSAPSSPISAFGMALDDAALESRVARLMHGTTVATNAVLQRRGARVCLLTTAGFEDVAFIQRLNRRYAFDLNWQKPTPLVLRRHVLGVRERLDAEGGVVESLGDDECERLVDKVAELAERDDIEAIAVCLLFSYVNPVHEHRLAESLRQGLPGLPLSLSSDVSPLWREYERVSTTLADAYVRPVMSAYLGDLEVEAARRNQMTVLMLKSNGGTAAPASIAPRPVTTLLSGLAGGVVGGAFFARQTGRRHAITLDMGGTSTDIGVVNDGEVGQLIEYEIEWGLPVVTPVVDVHTIGAGGGSIARVDEGGLLQVGPESAGAVPGPICYGQGGIKATVTDADLLLGRLNPDYFLGGLLRLEMELVRGAFVAMAHELQVATPEAAACAVVHIANENMANAVRLVTIERGIDPREYALVAFGGAGPMHACGVADALGISRIVIPPHSGLCSAFGAAIAPLRVDRIWSVGARLVDLSEEELASSIEEGTRAALAELERDGLAKQHAVERVLACRYYGQNYEHDVPVFDLAQGLVERVARSFHETHQAAFGYSFPHEPIELVHVRLTVRELADAPSIDYSPDPRGAGEGRRDIVDDNGHLITATVLRDRDLARPLSGPVVIEEPDTTIYVPEGWTVAKAQAGCLQLEGGNSPR